MGRRCFPLCLFATAGVLEVVALQHKGMGAVLQQRELTSAGGSGPKGFWGHVRRAVGLVKPKTDFKNPIGTSDSGQTALEQADAGSADVSDASMVSLGDATGSGFPQHGSGVRFWSVAANASKNVTENGVGQSRSQVAECEVGTPGCKSMCRWLKLTDKDYQNGRCPLFERPLISCGWVPPEQRIEGAPMLNDLDYSALDCSVNCMRTNVVATDVENQILHAEECMDSLPPDVNQTCIMALSLITNEVADWRSEMKLKADSEELRRDLVAAIAKAKIALATKSGQVPAIEELSILLSRAEDLPGHYLSDEVQEARSYLDRLAPVPAARRELDHAIADATAALNMQQPSSVTECIEWLEIAIRKAQRLGVGDPLPQAQAKYQELLALQAAQETLRAASFIGNVSLGTKSGMAKAIRELHSAIAIAQASNLSTAVAVSLMDSLDAIHNAVENSVNATAFGQAVLNTPGLKGKDEIKEAVSWLNRTIGRAWELGLQDDTSTSGALETLQALEYIKNARRALHTSVLRGMRTLQQNASELSDNAEEAAIETLKFAIKWGLDVGLVKGLPIARDLVNQLEYVESIKENTSLALAIGNASILAKADEDEAIALLAASIAASTQGHVSGGVHEAEHLLRLLASRKVARKALELATGMANKAFETRTREERAIVALNASIQEAQEADLTDEASIQINQLEQLEIFQESRKNLTQALAMTTSAPGRLGPVKVIDPQPEIPFNRTGYRIVSLPQPHGSADDGDGDFEEHIDALTSAIARIQHHGEIDPEWERMLAETRARRDAYEMINDAISVGNVSESTKTNFDMAIVNLTTALKEAGDSGVELGVPRARELLQQLNTIRPALNELNSAILQARVSKHTVSSMDSALSRLNRASAICAELQLHSWLPAAYKVRDELVEVRTVFLQLKAAIAQGEIALEAEQGEEAAIDELDAAMVAADATNMHRDVPVAVELLNRLASINAQHQRLQAAID